MKRAYTLVELLVVLAMIGIISSIAVINVSKLNMVTEEKEAKAFASDLKYTRSLALLNKKTYSFEVLGGNRSYRITEADGTQSITIKEVSMEKLKLTNNYDGSKYLVHFYPSSTASKSCTYQLTGEKEKFSVSIVVGTAKINFKKR